MENGWWLSQGQPDGEWQSQSPQQRLGFPEETWFLLAAETKQITSTDQGGGGGWCDWINGS